MFLTGFSSPFISIILAVILPWLIIIFGENTGQKIIAETKEIFRITEIQPVKEVLQNTYSYTTPSKESDDKQASASYKPKNEWFIFTIRIPGHGFPENDLKYIFYLSGYSGSRAPPLMFTI